jgi:hypothetical protein
MAAELPILASSRRAAKLLDLTEAEFLKLVEDGHLPQPREIAGFRRWDVSSLQSIATGAAIDAMDGVRWS